MVVAGAPAAARAPLPESYGPLIVETKTVDVTVEEDPRGPEGLITTMVTDLYVPATGGPWPTVVFSYGTCDTKRNFANWGPRLASRGFVVIVPNRRMAVDSALLGEPQGGQCLSQDPRINAADLLRVLRVAIGDPLLAGKVDPRRLALVGHSLGATFAALAADLAREEGPPLAALVLMEPGRWVSAVPEWTPEGVAPNLSVPTLVFATPEVRPADLGDPPNPIRVVMCEVGTRPECLLTPRHTFRALPGGLPKLGVEVVGATHFEPADPDDVDGDADGPRTGTERQLLFQRYAMAWLEVWLGCDRTALPFLNGPAAQADENDGKIMLFAGSTSFPPESLPTQAKC